MSPTLLTYFTQVLCLFHVLSTMHHTIVIRTLCEEKSTNCTMHSSEIWKRHAVLLGFKSKTPIRIFPRDWLSVWGPRKNVCVQWWQKNVQQLGSFLLIVLISKELLSLLVRSRSWLRRTPASQSCPLLGTWECLFRQAAFSWRQSVFFLYRLWKSNILSQAIKNKMKKNTLQTQASPRTEDTFFSNEKTFFQDYMMNTQNNPWQ